MRTPSSIGLIFGIAFGLGGLLAIVVGQRSYAKAREPERWPTAAGRITGVDVETRSRTFQDNRGFYYSANVPVRVVAYSYGVGDRELQGKQFERVTEGTRNTPIPTRYAVGQVVTIHYDASSPDTSFLDLPHRSNGGLVITILGGVFLLIGLLVPVLMRALFRSPPATTA